MSPPYEFSLRGSSARALLGRSAESRRRTLDLLEALAKNPFRAPDFIERGPGGRDYAVVVERDMVVTYWVDHATKEIRVIELEWV